MSQKSKKTNRGRKRIAEGLSLNDIARHFRAGVSRERIRQIEEAPKIRPETLEAYRAAIAAAVKERERIDAIIKRAAVEVAAEPLGS